MYETEIGHIPDGPDMSGLIEDLEEKARGTTVQVGDDETVANIGGDGPIVKAKIPTWLSTTIATILVAAAVAKAIGLW